MCEPVIESYDLYHVATAGLRCVQIEVALCRQSVCDIKLPRVRFESKRKCIYSNCDMMA